MTEGAAYKSLEVPGSIRAVERLCCELLARAQENHFSNDDIFCIHLALEEALSNAVKHGNKMEPGKTIQVRYSVDAEKFDVVITDGGRGFDPDSVPDPRSETNLYKSGGRGVLLIRSFMDIVEYNDKGNCVRLVKFKTNQANQPQ